MLHFSDKLTEEMNAAILRGDSRILKNYILNEKNEQKIYALFRNNMKKLYDTIQDIALHDKAPVFKKLMEKWMGDEEAIAAILRGFKADERFNNQPDFDERFGPSKDHADLEKKREILMEARSGGKPKRSKPKPDTDRPALER